MKKMIFSLLGLIAALNVSAQQDEVLMTVGGKPVMASEFMYIYEKNNQETTAEQKSMDEYLDLFIKFRLKVRQAEEEGIDTTAAFIKEFKGYRAQATPKYMQDNDAIDSLIEMSYNRMAKPRRAAHIAIECPQDANDSLRQARLQEMEVIRQRVTSGGEDFMTVARETSMDPSVRDNGGELGIITPFRYVYCFEDAVYNTPVGGVTPIFRSPYGYHIALVEEETTMEEIHAAHIMAMVPRGDSLIEIEKKALIDSLYAVLQAGADFATIAKDFSEDRGSASRGGDLGWFARGMMVKPFEDAAFSMNEEGSISAPFRSRYGWHIIQYHGRRGIQPLDSLRAQLAKSIQRDERMQEADKSFLRKARAEYHLPATMPDDQVRAYAEEHLEDKYPEFRNLVKEYHDGILLFETSLRNVWDKASNDPEGLATYFKKHKKTYAWDEPRFKGYAIYAKNDTVAQRAKELIRAAKEDSIESYISHYINQDSLKLVRVEKGLWKKGQHKLVDRDIFKVAKHGFIDRAELPIATTCGKLIKKPETYLDERGRVTSDYQDQLEVEWVEHLRTLYPVVVNKEVFERLKKENQ